MALDENLSLYPPPTDITGNKGRIFGSNNINDPETEGCISDFRIYGRVLSDAEMLDLFTTTYIVPPITPTVPDLDWYKYNGDILNYCRDDLGKKDATLIMAERYSPYLSKQCFHAIPGQPIIADGYPRVPGLPNNKSRNGWLRGNKNGTRSSL
jgi:hypothetical protein